jgi:leucine dehydrogenase
MMVAMTTEMMELLGSWDGEGVVVRHDRPTGTWIFIAIHDTTLGPATGGCRIKQYPTPADGLKDALRLAEGMTYKWGSIGFPHGGGKSVLAIPGPVEGEARSNLFKRFGRLLAALQGAYSTGQDLGTTTSDMAVIAATCSHVMGAPQDGSELTDPGPFTALGVFEGMKAALRHADGSDDLAGVRVLVQGVGDVGAPLARMVADAGGAVLLSDLDTQRAEALASSLGAQAVDPGEVYRTPCDVYAPCAVGATVNADTIPVLGCRIVAGSANNQLAVRTDAQRLLDRGILYTPDYVINAGGAMAFGLIHQGIEDDEEIARRVSTIGRSLDEIFADAEADEITPLDAAERRVDRLVARTRREQGLGPEFDR